MYSSFYKNHNENKLYSKSIDKGFMNYIDIIGNEHFNLFTKNISINDKRIIDMYSIIEIAAGLLRSGENISWNFLIPSTERAGLLPTLRRYFSLYYLQNRKR